MERNGAAELPGLLSDPVVDTHQSAASDVCSGAALHTIASAIWAPTNWRAW
jgi:hypothetical protein